MKETRSRLQHLLEMKDSRVIALSGKWGTGKTHMLAELKALNVVPDLKGSLQISIFGLSTIDDLQLRFFDRVFTRDGGEAEFLKIFRKSTVHLFKAITEKFRISNSAQAMAILALPRMLKSKLLIIDDIERKHDKLSIDEILGFIDEFVNQYNCRVLLVLNSDKLHDSSLWNQFREKVIDDEIQLNTTPEEAFAIACPDPSQVGGEIIREAAILCDITNIRILRKIIRVVNGLVVARGVLAEGVLRRTIPSIVLLSAIYYGGIDGGPSMNWVLKYNGRVAAFLRHSTDEVEESSESLKESQWIDLLMKLKIHSSDDFELLVADFLSKGLIDNSKVKSIINAYASADLSLIAEYECNVFYNWCQWNPEVKDEEVIENGEGLVKHAPYISAFNVTTMVELLEEYNGGSQVALKFIKEWGEARRKYMERPDAKPYHFDIDTFVGRKIDPRIIEIINELETLNKPKRDFMDVLFDVVRARNWSSPEIAVVRDVSFDRVFEAVSSESGDRLKSLFSIGRDLYKHRHTYDQFIGNFPIHFVNACANFIEQKPESRRAALILSCFKSVGCTVERVDYTQPQD